MYRRKTLMGMTLIELMVGLLSGVIILGTLIEVYYMSQQNYFAQSALYTLEENARLISALLADRIRMAGFIGCARLTDDFPFINHTQINLNRHNKISYFQTSANKPGTDAFTIWQASHSSALLLQNMQNNSTFYVTKKLVIATGDILFISDCKAVELFHVKTVAQLNSDEQIVTTLEPLTKFYQQNAEVIPFEMSSYFIADTGRSDANHQPIYALYNQTLNQPKTELVEGVNAMQIDYISREGSKMIQHYWHENVDSDALLAISLKLSLSSITHIILQKNWYIYVALREI